MKKFLRWWLGIEAISERIEELEKPKVDTWAQAVEKINARLSELESLKPKPKVEAEPGPVPDFVPFTKRRTRAQHLGTNPSAYIAKK